MDSTEAWVLREASPDCRNQSVGSRLMVETIPIGDIREDEVLVECLLGTWEGNMGHALRRSPIDVCRHRGEAGVVLGNSGVVRVLRPGPAAADLREGDLCILFCNSEPDDRGFPTRIFGYDAPGTIGLLAKRTKVKAHQLIPVPIDTRYSLEQWAAFSLRYITAWANWRVAHGCWRLLAPDSDGATTWVWGWGGGVALAELHLAALSGYRALMIGSCDERLDLIRTMGMNAIDRRHFLDLSLEEEKYDSDPAYRARYCEAERFFLDVVRRETDGNGVSIFVDYIGSPVYRATLKALGRPGVLTTAGWKAGMALSTLRAIECMNWHVHVHTHYARKEDALDAIRFGEENGWIPPAATHTYDWSEIPCLAEDYECERNKDYFPTFRIAAQ